MVEVTINDFSRMIKKIIQNPLHLFRYGFIASYLLAAVPFVFLIRLVSPFVLFRFHRLESDRIGPFTMNPEVYLSELDAGLHKKGDQVFLIEGMNSIVQEGKFKTIDLFYFNTKTCNKYLKKLWKRSVTTHQLFMPLDMLNKLMPGNYLKHIVPMRRYSFLDVNGILNTTKPHLIISEEERKQGESYLISKNITNEEFICIHARDSAYLEKNHKGEANWKYHSFRDTDINDMVNGLMPLVMKKKYSVFRMGAVVDKEINISDSKVIDYAANGDRTDFLDIYLSANCRFFVTDSAGICCVPQAFRRPIVAVNLSQLNLLHTWDSSFVLLPRKFWLTTEKRFLKFSEILNHKIGYSCSTEEFKEHNIELIYNTIDEISEAINEMEMRLTGEWVESESDEILQKKFWSNYGPIDNIQPVIRAHICSNFLRNNKDLL